MMMVSTKGRYALRVIIDLAESGSEGYTPMKNVAERQGISLKYLERILPLLVSAGLVEGVHGKGGGYKLSRKPAKITVGEVLRAAEGDIAPVACLECNADIYLQNASDVGQIRRDDQQLSGQRNYQGPHGERVTAYARLGPPRFACAEIARITGHSLYAVRF